MPTTIDLNADVGEGFASDAAIVPLVTSANVACGAHAGDDESMYEAVRLAQEAGVAIGAHPGHADRQHFGRRELPCTRATVERLVREQIETLDHFAFVLHNEPLRYVKPHGGLYHQVSRDAELAAGLATAAAVYWNGPLPILGPAGSAIERVAREAGLAFYAEAYADRAYRDDGTLPPRSMAGAMIDDADRAAEQAVRLATEGRVRTLSGNEIEVRCDSVCLHGDSAGAIDRAHAVREALLSAGVTLGAFTA